MTDSTFSKNIKALKKRADKMAAKAATKATAKKSVRNSEDYCSEISQAVDNYLERQCTDKANKLSACKGEDSDAGCSCGGGSDGKVDLVVLIDSSSSMSSSAQAINDASVAGLEAAKAECGSDVRVNWFWVDSSKPGSSPNHSLGTNAAVFSQSHQQYLEGIGVPGPFYHDQVAGSTSWHGEQGADAVADISDFYDWRKGACRSILYISDTNLEGVGGTPAEDDAAVTQAVSVATTNAVTVFAHYLRTNAVIAEDYRNLTEGTGGSAVTGQAPSEELYKELLVKAVCECGGGCKEVEFPDLEPCISVSWGDSECDALETDDVETLCISVCNCYTNVTFSNFRIGYLWITDENGRNVPTLPDGTPSVAAIPVGPVCFGDIPPCIDNEPSCITREFVIVNRGAKPGKYKLSLGAICYDVNQHFDKEKCFEFDLCRS